MNDLFSGEMFERDFGPFFMIPPDGPEMVEHPTDEQMDEYTAFLYGHVRKVYTWAHDNLDLEVILGMSRSATDVYTLATSLTSNTWIAASGPAIFSMIGRFYGEQYDSPETAQKLPFELFNNFYAPCGHDHCLVASYVEVIHIYQDEVPSLDLDDADITIKVVRGRMSEDGVFWPDSSLN